MPNIGILTLDLLFLIAIIPDLISSQKYRDQNSPRIINGKEANIKDYPYMAFLTTYYPRFDRFECGGSIIGAQFILTAASCIVHHETPPRILINGTIRIGSTRSSTGGHVYTFFRNHLIPHPKYDKKTNDFDVGLIRVPEGMKINMPHIPRIIKLIRGGQSIEMGSILKVAGWGSTQDLDYKRSEVLRSLEVISFENEFCKKQFLLRFLLLTDRMFCAGIIAGGRGTYEQDTGGPVVNEEGIQVGIISFNYGNVVERRNPHIRTNITCPAIRGFIYQNSGI